jgi:hypothetical protein
LIKSEVLPGPTICIAARRCILSGRGMGPELEFDCIANGAAKPAAIRPVATNIDRSPNGGGVFFIG